MQYSEQMRKALKVSLEGEGSDLPEETVIQSLQELQASDIRPALVVADAVRAQEGGVALADAIDAVADRAAEIDEAADDALILASVESLNFSLVNLLKSHDIRVKGVSLESHGTGAGALHDLKTQLASHSTAVQTTLRASLESSYDASVKSAGEIAAFEEKSKQVLNQAISKITAKQKDLETNGVTLNYQGMYGFLQYDNAPVLELAPAMVRELATVKKLMDLLERLTKFHDKLAGMARSIGGDGKKELKDFVSAMMDFDIERELKAVEGFHLLQNGVTVKSNTEDYTGDQDVDSYGPVYSVLEIYYMGSGTDGSKASIKDRILGGFRGGIKGMVIGGVVGALVGNAPGLTIGGIGGGAIGTLVGVTGANSKVLGANTNSTTSVKDVIAFLKSNVEMAGLAKDLASSMNDVASDAAKVANYFEMFVGLMDTQRDAMLEMVGIVGKLVGAEGGKGDGDSQMRNMRRMVRERLDSLYALHMSVAEATSAHAWLCTKHSLVVAEALVTAAKAQ